MALGGYYDPQYKFEAADIIVSLDADFLSGSWCPGFVRYARDFMSRRKLMPSQEEMNRFSAAERAPAAGADSRPEQAPTPRTEMNRFYVAESSPTTTGAKADHRLMLRHSEVEKIARALAAKAGVAGVGAVQLSEEQQKWVDVVFADLAQVNKDPTRSLVVPGEFQSPAVHALAHAINAALGNVGKTVTYIDPVEVDAVEHTQSLRELVDDVNAGKVETLIIIGGDPVYNAPADLNFEAALQKIKLNIQLSNYKNDTTPSMHWHIPEAHYLESWSDARAYDGTASIVQPLIMPLYGGKTAHEVMNVLVNQADQTAHDTVRAYWQTQHKAADFDDYWQISLHDGVVAGTALPEKTQPPVKLPAVSASTLAASGLEIVFRPDPSVGDGVMSNNAWLQELPKPQNK